MKVASLAVLDRGYLSADLRIVDRNEAAIKSHDKIVLLAERKFGENWQQYTRLEERSIEEWISYNARQGGRSRSWKKLRHLRRLAKLKSAEAKRRKKLERQQRKEGVRAKVRRPRSSRRFWWTNGTLAVRARTVGEANRTVRRINRSILRGDLRRHWCRGKPDPALLEKNGVFRLSEQDQWLKIL